VPGHDHASIGYALDAGASIIVPQVETVEDVKHIISAKNFGADINGTRSAPPCRMLPGLSNLPLNPKRTVWQNLNDTAGIMIQVETVNAINNLDAILTECGHAIDCVWLGSLDCRISMGLTDAFGPEPEWLEVDAKCRATLAKHDMPYAGFAIGTPEQMAALGQGKCVVFTGMDLFAILGAGLGQLQVGRELFPTKNYSVENKTAAAKI
jgi:4-hydroxy-2-oxoheptanedioate aldolase